jgi:hypothetical protein
MTGKPGVIYLLKDRFQLFSPYLRQMVEFRFVPEIVRDSDIINRELLENLIKVFVTNGKIQPSNLYIVLADNAYFVKDFVIPAPPPPQKGVPPPPPISMETIHVLSMDFIEHVPYENVVSKTFPLKNGLKVCAVNKDFFDAIKVAFEKLGFTIDGVFPGVVLGNNLTARPAMDGALISLVLQKAPSLKQYDLMTEEVYKPVAKAGAETSVDMELEDFKQQSKKPDKKRLYGMVGLLAVLLIILAVVYVTSTAQPPPPPPIPAVPQKAAVPIIPSPEVSPTASVELSPTPKSGISVDPEEAKLLTVQLTNTSAPASSVDKLRTALSKFGFASMNTNSQSSLSSAQTIVIFSVLPSTQMKAAVLTEVKKITPNVQVQEKTDASSDITILLGK